MQILHPHSWVPSLPADSGPVGMSAVGTAPQWHDPVFSCCPLLSTIRTGISPKNREIGIADRLLSLPYLVVLEINLTLLTW